MLIQNRQLAETLESVKILGLKFLKTAKPSPSTSRNSEKRERNSLKEKASIRTKLFITALFTHRCLAFTRLSVYVLYSVDTYSVCRQSAHFGNDNVYIYISHIKPAVYIHGLLSFL